MIKAIERANELVATRINAVMTVEERDGEYHYKFEFESFTVNMIAKLEDYSQPYSWFPRAILDGLQASVLDRYLQNGNFTNHKSEYVPGTFISPAIMDTWSETIIRPYFKGRRKTINGKGLWDLAQRYLGNA